MNCTAAPLADGGVVLWIPTQAQSRVQNGVAKALDLAPERVTVHTLLSGGGFGRRTVDDHAVQAALIARATGSAVKLIWSREEDTRHGIYRPAVVARLRAGIAPDGKLTVLRTTAAGTHEYIPGGLVALTYDIPTICWSHKIETHGIPGGPWRSVGRSHNIFFLDCFLEEVAAEIGKDALSLRLELLSAQPRGRSVLTRVADAIGYGRPAPAGRFRGLGYSRGFGSYCAAAVELSVTNKVVTLHRIVGALDCGTVVNPDSVRAQMEGGLLMGLNACMQEEITLEQGGVVQANFDTYPLLTMSQTPPLELYLLETPDVPAGGVGETMVPPVMPALANALFAATGERLRRMPLSSAGYRFA